MIHLIAIIHEFKIKWYNTLKGGIHDKYKSRGYN